MSQNHVYKRCLLKYHETCVVCVCFLLWLAGGREEGFGGPRPCTGGAFVSEHACFLEAGLSMSSSWTSRRCFRATERRFRFGRTTRATKGWPNTKEALARLRSKVVFKTARVAETSGWLCHTLSQHNDWFSAKHQLPWKGQLRYLRSGASLVSSILYIWLWV